MPRKETPITQLVDGLLAAVKEGLPIQQLPLTQRDISKNCLIRVRFGSKF